MESYRGVDGKDQEEELVWVIEVMHWRLGRLHLVDLREEVSQGHWLCGQIWLEMEVRASSEAAETRFRIWAVQEKGQSIK